MKVEVGKVYKCGSRFVYIESKSSKLDSWHLNPYIGISCTSTVEEESESCSNTYIGRFSTTGDFGAGNVLQLRYHLEELHARETITIGSSVYYKDEFEEATKHLKEVKQ